MRYLAYFICFMFFVVCTGCAAVDQQRRVSYVRSHPELTAEQKDLILSGKLWVGMTFDEVKAVLGPPDATQLDELKDRVIWAYQYKGSYTTYSTYKYNRALRLEFIYERLANWRED